MRAFRSKLTYSNVIASIAMFLALTGGTVMAAKLRSGDIAANAIKKKNLAKNSIVNADFRKKSLITQTATGGGQTVNVDPALGTIGTPLPLSGKTTFTPKKGYIGLLMVEGAATLASADPVGDPGCGIGITIYVNGEAAVGLFLNDTSDSSISPPTGAPFTDHQSGVAPIGLLGGPQTISAVYNGDASCTATSKIDTLKIAVQKSR